MPYVIPAIQFALAKGGAAAFFIKLVATTLISVATSKLFAPKVPKGAGIGSRQVMSRSALAYRNIVYGKAMVSGPVVYNNLAGPTGQELWFVVAVADGESEDIEAIWFDNSAIPASDIDWTPGTGGADGTGTGEVSTAKWVGTDSTKAVTLFYYLGHPDQVVCAELDSAFLNIDTNFRGRGITYVVAKLLYTDKTEEIWQEGVPSSIKALVKGRRVYDPRLDSTNGGSGLHRYTDDSTWEWSENPALCVADYLVNFMDVDPAISINWTSIADAADDCEVSVAIPVASTEDRFTCNGSVSLGTSHKENLDALVSSCDGRLSYSQGVWKLRAGVWEASSTSITESDLAGPVEVRGSAPKAERVNKVRGFFIDPGRKHQAVEFPHVDDSTYLTRDAGEEISFDLELPMTNSQYMAQRIAYRNLEQGNNQIACTLILNSMGADIAVGDVVDVTISYLSWSAKTFRCVEWSRLPEGTFKLVLREDSSSAYTDPLEGDYTTVGSGTVTVPSYVVPAPSALSATSRPYAIQLTWTNPALTEFDIIDVYMSSSSAWSGATKIGSVYSDTFTMSLGEGETRYFWVRARRHSGEVSDRYPDSDTSTVVGTAGGTADSVQLTGATLSDELVTANDAEVSYRLASGGEEQSYEGDGGTHAKIDDWLLAGSAGDYDCRLTVNSGTNPTGSSLGTWLDCGTTRTWTLTDSVEGGGQITNNCTIEIRDGTSLDVLASATVVMTVDKQAPSLALSGGTYTAYKLDANSQMEIKIDNDGKVYKSTNGGTYIQISTATNWIRPASEAPDDYEVRYTNATGDTGALTVTTAEDTWHALSGGDWTIEIEDTTPFGGPQEATFTIEIRKGSSGGADETGSYTISAERDSSS